MKILRVDTQAARNVRRYSIVRAVSRGGDLIISSAIEAVFGGGWFWYITALGTGGIFNLVTDYVGQKYWVNESKTKRAGFTLKETGRYAALRAFYLPIGLASHATLYQIVGLSFFLSSLLVSIMLWAISYRNTRGVFSSHSTRWVPWPLRSRVVLRRRGGRKRVRTP
ncbi:MAG: hypothetical protein RL538_509 [Candidatus Parcubacteria bacterium]|jgi:hypothetical protein